MLTQFDCSSGASRCGVSCRARMWRSPPTTRLRRCMGIGIGPGLANLALTGVRGGLGWAPNAAPIFSTKPEEATEALLPGQRSSLASSHMSRVWGVCGSCPGRFQSLSGDMFKVFDKSWVIRLGAVSARRATPQARRTHRLQPSLKCGCRCDSPGCFLAVAGMQQSRCQHSASKVWPSHVRWFGDRCLVDRA